MLRKYKSKQIFTMFTLTCGIVRCTEAGVEYIYLFYTLAWRGDIVCLQSVLNEFNTYNTHHMFTWKDCFVPLFSAPPHHSSLLRSYKSKRLPFSIEYYITDWNEDCFFPFFSGGKIIYWYVTLSRLSYTNIKIVCQSIENKINRICIIIMAIQHTATSLITIELLNASL